jgi:hypothetical protein
MTAPGLFICGCNPNDPHVKNYTSDPRRDKDNRQVCPIHGKPMYGIATESVHDSYERIYGKIKTSPIPAGLEDRRDTRDPAELGEQVLAELAARRNGSGPVDTLPAK